MKLFPSTLNKVSVLVLEYLIFVRFAWFTRVFQGEELSNFWVLPTYVTQDMSLSGLYWTIEVKRRKDIVIKYFEISARTGDKIG